MYETIVPPAVLGTAVVAQTAPVDPAVHVPAAAQVAATASEAMLPVTGIAIGGLVAMALVLLIVGVVLHTIAARQHRANDLAGTPGTSQPAAG